MTEVATGRAKAVKVGTKSAREHKTVPRARDRVIVAKRPGFKLFARRGRVYEVATDIRGKTIEGGSKRRIPLEPYRPGGPIEQWQGAGRRRGWVVTIDGMPTNVFFANYETAQNYANQVIGGSLRRRGVRFNREGGLVVSLDPMSRDEWDEIMDARDQRNLERRRLHRARDRQRRALARSVRPFR